MRQGYKFQSSDADRSDPFPTVSMRTETDDFWMTALTGVLDKAKGEGLAAITVTSPCFSPGGDSAPDTAALRSSHADERAARGVLDHSSRIYEALQVRHASAAQDGEGLGSYQNAEGAFVQPTWSTPPLTEGAVVQAVGRAAGVKTTASKRPRRSASAALRSRTSCVRPSSAWGGPGAASSPTGCEAGETLSGGHLFEYRPEYQLEFSRSRARARPRDTLSP